MAENETAPGYGYAQWSEWQKWAFNRLSVLARAGGEHHPASYAIRQLTRAARVGGFVAPELREKIIAIIERRRNL